MEGEWCLDRFFSLSVVISEAAGIVPNRLNGSTSRAISRKMEDGSSGESRTALARTLVEPLAGGTWIT